MIDYYYYCMYYVWIWIGIKAHVSLSVGLVWCGAFAFAWKGEEDQRPWIWTAALAQHPNPMHCMHRGRSVIPPGLGSIVYGPGRATKE